MYYKDRVILLKGNNSNWYEQAIFIVRDKKENDKPIDLVEEAEKIANGLVDYPTKMVTIYETKSSKFSKPKARAKARAKAKAIPKQKANAKHKNTIKTDPLLHFLMIIGCVVAAGMFFWYFKQ